MPSRKSLLGSVAWGRGGKVRIREWLPSFPSTLGAKVRGDAHLRSWVTGQGESTWRRFSPPPHHWEEKVPFWSVPPLFRSPAFGGHTLKCEAGRECVEGWHERQKSGRGRAQEGKWWREDGPRQLSCRCQGGDAIYRVGSFSGAGPSRKGEGGERQCLLCQLPGDVPLWLDWSCCCTAGWGPLASPPPHRAPFPHRLSS